MAFPTTGVLDAFTGAGPTIPPSANWTIPANFTKQLRLTGSQVDSESATLNGADYWNPATFGPDAEAFVTVATLPGNDGNGVRLYLRVSNPASATIQTGYYLRWNWKSASADEWQLFRIDNNVSTQLGSTVTQDIVAGDKLGVEMIGSTLTAYRFTSGAWASVTSQSDATYTAAGNLILAVGLQTAKLDDFGGGTVVATDLPPLPTVVDTAVARAANY